MTCTCGHTSDEHSEAEATKAHGYVAGVCKICACEAFTAPGSMRVMYARRCTACGREWKAPSKMGNCPTCHSTTTLTIGMQNNGLKRV
jgi:hypothetical protein